jgi:hypothetical protein
MLFDADDIGADTTIGILLALCAFSAYSGRT